MLTFDRDLSVLIVIVHAKKSNCDNQTDKQCSGQGAIIVNLRLRHFRIIGLVQMKLKSN